MRLRLRERCFQRVRERNSDRIKERSSDRVRECRFDRIKGKGALSFTLQLLPSPVVGLPLDLCRQTPSLLAVSGAAVAHRRLARTASRPRTRPTAAADRWIEPAPL